MENQAPQPTRLGVKKKKLTEDQSIAHVNIGLGAEMVGRLNPKFMSAVAKKIACHPQTARRAQSFHHQNKATSIANVGRLPVVIEEANNRNISLDGLFLLMVYCC